MMEGANDADEGSSLTCRYGGNTLRKPSGQILFAKNPIQPRSATAAWIEALVIMLSSFTSEFLPANQTL
jgi:hypothetical protein